MELVKRVSGTEALIVKTHGEQNRAQLELVPPGRSTREFSDVVVLIDKLADQAGSSIQNAASIRRYVGDPDPLIRSYASSLLARVADATLVFGREESNPQSVSPVFRWGRRLDNRLDGSRGALRLLHRPLGDLRRVWALAGLGLTVVAAVFVAYHFWLSALLVVALRVSVSTLLGSTYDLPFESSNAVVGRSTATLLRCLVSHVGDALILVGGAFAFVIANRPGYAMTMMSIVTVMLLATLCRVAALQVGVQLYRLVVER